MSKKDIRRLTVVLTLSTLLGAMEEPRKAQTAVGPLVAAVRLASCSASGRWRRLQRRSRDK